MPALAIALAWAPGALVAARLAPRAGPETRAMLALVLSPFLAGAPACLLLAAGAGPAATARTILLAVAALAAWSAWAPARPAATPAGDPAAARAVRGSAAAWCGIVAVFLLANRALMARSDGWFHAALTLQVARRGLPPEDPFFAGFPLHYFWGTHAWSALWLGAAPPVSVWAPLVTLTLAGAAATMLAVGEIARRLGAGPRGVWAAAAAAVLGYMPFGWVTIAARALRGEVTGLDEVRRLVDLGGATMITIMSGGTLHGSLAFFGDKFLLLTPFAIGVAAFAATIVMLLDLAAEPSPGAAVALTLAAGAALFVAHAGRLDRPPRRRRLVAVDAAAPALPAGRRRAPRAPAGGARGRDGGRRCSPPISSPPRSGAWATRGPASRRARSAPGSWPARRWSRRASCGSRATGAPGRASCCRASPW